MADLMQRVLRLGEGRKLKDLERVTRSVNRLEDEISALDDGELGDRFEALRVRVRAAIAEGAKPDEALGDVAAEAFAIVREAGWRSMEMRHFDVQIMGGFALHYGWIAEMRTGEGKTLTAVLAVALNSLTGRGVHVVTVNDYLAQRDAEWMGPIYRFLRIPVGVIWSQMDQDDRRAAYQADVTYGTNSEFGFDYLRDNLAVELDGCVQRGHPFAIVDEVDSILIDEARTPLIISGQPEDAPQTYYEFARIGKRLKVGVDYDVDEKRKTVAPSEEAVHKVERWLGIENLYAPGNGQMVNHLIQALKAESLFSRDVEYVVQNGEVKIVDEFTGRIMEGRRWSEGLHQAVEAKEGVKIEAENVTVATVTIQNYFRMYEKLAGMTGTAATEATEFSEIYKLEVCQIPTNVGVIRDDANDVVFKTHEEKFAAVADDVAARHAAGQPVLVGTISIEISEYLSGLLTDRGIPHNVLNAKQHEREASIIEDAGQPGAVTIATNMAGRGVDIKLGDGVPDAGGLYVLGTERHESRRIDNQLRGRSGRQGDPGETRFYISAEDEVVRLFAGDRMFKILDRFGPTDGEPLDSKMLTRSIEGAQRRVEERNFEIRKNVLKYDDVLNKQREVVYAERRRVLEGEDISPLVEEWIDEAVEAVIADHTESDYAGDWDVHGLIVGLSALYPVPFAAADLGDPTTIDRDELLDRATAEAQLAYEERERSFTDRLRELGAEDAEDGHEPGWDIMRRAERYFLLDSIDHHWREHLDNMEYLRDGIHLRGLAQKDPLVEYRTEGHAMFIAMMRDVREQVVKNVFHFDMELQAPDDAVEQLEPREDDDRLVAVHQEAEAIGGGLNVEQPAGGGAPPPDTSGMNRQERRAAERRAEKERRARERSRSV